MAKPKAKGRHHYPLPKFPPAEFPGAFQDNIQMFVSGYGELLVGNATMPTWFTILADQKSGAGVPLYTVEEYVRNSTDQSCVHCSCTGWSKHFVCKYRYHFIIPAEDEWVEHLDPDHINKPTHLLHGMVHGNGFGHLIQMKWPDRKTKCIPGGVIMDLWDRICTSLRTRQVSVVDVARWKNMELRLLLGVARKLPWYGLWDYNKFHRETLGVTETKYRKSTKLLSSVNLDNLMKAGSGGWTAEQEEMQYIVDTYRRRSESSIKQQVIETLGNLFHYMLELLEFEKQMKPTLLPNLPSCDPLVECSNKQFVTEAKDFTEVAAKLQRKFPMASLVNAAEAIAEVLRVGLRGQKLKMTMTRKELRDAAMTKVRNTGLLDTVLKNIVDCIVGNHVVRRLYNQSSGVLEYAIEDRHLPECENKKLPVVVNEPTCAGVDGSLLHIQVVSDIAWIYENVLLKGPYQDAVTSVLMSKRWLKVWPMGTEKNGRLSFSCHWMPSAELPPLQRSPEVIVVMKPDMVVGELMREAEKGFRETYCAMEGFRATSLEQVNGKVWVAGVGVDLEWHKLIYECQEDLEEDKSSSSEDNCWGDVLEYTAWQHSISNVGDANR